MDDLSLSNPTTIGYQSLASIPEAYEMFQNYPNPFNPVTHIRYGIPTASEVNIEVYNSLGQRVAVLENDYQTAGYHVVDFDAARFPSGIYFYRIDAGSFHKMMKMILMK
jgi:2',3'-cyclic-nucleotide 2'-phosphodiesterase/3'-nucleotidase/5'-nucleotidase